MGAARAMTTTPDHEPKPLYRPDGGGFAPTSLSASPWQADAQNGVSLGALMAHTLGVQANPEGAYLARFTLDILRPAPRALTRVVWRVARAGRRVRLLEGELEAGGVIAARASALFVAPDGPAPPALALVPPAIPPEEAPPRPLNPRESGLESRLIQRGQPSEGVKLSLWVRVKAPIVPGAWASPITTAIAAADTGGAALGDYGAAWNFPNLDIAVHFARAPHGDWVHVDAEAMVLGNGTAVINHRLSDRQGAFARGHQTLFLTRRQPRAAA
jgi:hypothetical protein